MCVAMLVKLSPRDEPTRVKEALEGEPKGNPSIGGLPSQLHVNRLYKI